MTTKDDYRTRIFYAELADKLSLAPLWKQYAAALALYQCGPDCQAGAALIQCCRPGCGPLKTAQCTADAAIQAQLEVCLPLMETERRAFIKTEHGRLQAAVGTDYWDAKTETNCHFHQFIEESKEEETKPDPYDIGLDELARLPHLVKRVERIGTYSYLAFFNMFPQDAERLRLIAGLWRRLTHNCVCTQEELEALFSGHADYLDWKLKDTVVVIAPKAING